MSAYTHEELEPEFDELPADEFEAGADGQAEDSFEGESGFDEMEEMQLAAELLEITDESELDQFIGKLLKRAARTAGRGLHSSLGGTLGGYLKGAVKQALPMVGGALGNLLAPGVGGDTGSRLAAAAGNLFGLELEGLSPEDQEFEVARRFVRFAGAGARNARGFRASTPPQIAARRALGAAARRHAPGFLRRHKPRPPQHPQHPRRPGGVRVAPTSPDWPDYEPAQPLPIAVTCHCGGTPQTAPATDPAAAGDNANPLPDADPANSTEPATTDSNEPQTEYPEGTNYMHDLDRTTMEITDETADFEFPESQDEYGRENAESTFSEEEEAELAAELLEINDEAELDQFIGRLLKKARRLVGGALKSPLLRPLGGFIKGAIKKALPIAGGALGNMVVPGLGGQIGSRLASGAGGLLGLELEGLAPEDQEFEVAKQVVRTIGTAVQNAAQSPTAATDPQAAAKAAMVAAARTHLPGLLQGQQQRNGAGHRPRSGRWYRRGGKIVLVGV